MPIYEYECRSCYARFEVKQSMMDEPVKVCPTCNGEVRRVLQPVGIVFKGSGFYITDHGRKGSTRSSEEAAAKPEVSKEAAKKEEKSEPVAASATTEKKTDR